MAEKVDGVILTSTWGTCTRCGATIVKQLEAAKIPAVHICTVTPISKSVGANRIVPGISIPYVVGNPNVSKEEEKKVRERIISVAIEALQTDISQQKIFKVD